MSPKRSIEHFVLGLDPLREGRSIGKEMFRRDPDLNGGLFWNDLGEVRPVFGEVVPDAIERRLSAECSGDVLRSAVVDHVFLGMGSDPLDSQNMRVVVLVENDLAESKVLEKRSSRTIQDHSSVLLNRKRGAGCAESLSLAQDLPHDCPPTKTLIKTRLSKFPTVASIIRSFRLECQEGPQVEKKEHTC